MLEKIGQSAETVVSRVNVSRRGFLGKAAKVAAGLGAIVAGFTAFPTDAEARSATRSASCWCYSNQRLTCFYENYPKAPKYKSGGCTCATHFGAYRLTFWWCD